MASSGKKKTTMAKLSRESRLRERRLDKKARKDARRQAAADLANGVTTALPDDALSDDTALDDPTPADTPAP